MVYGDPRCRNCRGRGYVRIYGRVTRCGCVTPSRATTAILRKANARDDRPYKSLGEMVQDYAKTIGGQSDG